MLGITLRHLQPARALAAHPSTEHHTPPQPGLKRLGQQRQIGRFGCYQQFSRHRPVEIMLGQERCQNRFRSDVIILFLCGQARKKGLVAQQAAFAEHEHLYAGYPGPQHAGDYIKIAADSIATLRKVDVFRVIESVRPDNIDGVSRASLSRWISAERPDLSDEVADVLEELTN